jgi:hypothetical protein
VIVRRTASAQLLITQPNHAALAGRIMQHWAAAGLRVSPRRAEIMLAVAEHDNGWREVDAAPIVDAATGRILDFITAPGDVRRGVWPRGVERLAGTPYAAALVAQHALHIYARYRADPDWQAFFREMESARDRQLRRAAVSLEELLCDYLFVRAGDVISLAFCNDWRDEQDAGGACRVRLQDGVVVVTPDPFAGTSFSIDVAAVEVPDTRFASAAEALERVERGRPRLLTGMVRGE